MKSVAVAFLIYLHATYFLLALPQTGKASRKYAGDSNSAVKIEERRVENISAVMEELSKAPGWKYLDRDRCGLESLKKTLGTNNGSSKRGFSGRIFGGIRARTGQFPWTVRLLYGFGRWKVVACGGALISKRHVLTAAHCIDENLSQVKAGSGRNTQTLPIKMIIIHADYEETYSVSDIALVILRKDAVFNDFVGSVCLPLESLSEDSFAGKTGIVAGWGKTETKISSDVLLMVEVPIMDNQDCRKLKPLFSQIQPYQVCAGGEAGKDSCQGDSGGPLIVKDTPSDKYCVVGVVSYGYGCGRIGMPGVYTRVTYFVPWILKNMD